MPEFVSELIGKPLLTRKGEYRGCVKNVQTDARLLRIRNLECFDAEEEEFLLPASAVAPRIPPYPGRSFTSVPALSEKQFAIERARWRNPATPLVPSRPEAYRTRLLRQAFLYGLSMTTSQILEVTEKLLE